MNRIAVGLVVCLISLSSTMAQARTWTDIFGNELNGTFKSFNKNNGIVVITQNGQRISAPFSGFCRDDRDFIINELKKSGRQNEVAKYDTEIPDVQSSRDRFNRGPGAGQPQIPQHDLGNGAAPAGGASPGVPPGFEAKGAMPNFPAGAGGAFPAAGNFPTPPGMPGQFPGRPGMQNVPGIAHAPAFDQNQIAGKGAMPQRPADSFPQAGPPAAHSFQGGGIAGVDPAMSSTFPQGPIAGEPPVHTPQFPNHPFKQPAMPTVETPSFPSMPSYTQVLKCDKCGFVATERSGYKYGDRCPQCAKNGGGFSARGVRGIIWIVVLVGGAIGAAIKKIAE
ncbi:MAG: hypothetical protein O2955_13945 [Planctomycetota bacterium]|nr:hypothetical protein [Planctomycetota bacterium]MDA1213613.1 hypothetical protein [Planctomycetota bacterium]